MPIIDRGATMDDDLVERLGPTSSQQIGS